MILNRITHDRTEDGCERYVLPPLISRVYARILAAIFLLIVVLTVASCVQRFEGSDWIVIVVLFVAPLSLGLWGSYTRLANCTIIMISENGFLIDRKIIDLKKSKTLIPWNEITAFEFVEKLPSLPNPVIFNVESYRNYVSSSISRIFRHGMYGGSFSTFHSRSGLILVHYTEVAFLINETLTVPEMQWLHRELSSQLDRYVKDDF